MESMAKGEIVINQELCKGCGYCVKFCSRGCIIIGDKFNAQGYPVAQFTQVENCTACEVCAWMCPESVIEVYKYQRV
jgi:2-oxoglutarate ferredoxin oxidoreductase subunit delta